MSANANVNQKEISLKRNRIVCMRLSVYKIVKVLCVCVYVFACMHRLMLLICVDFYKIISLRH